MLFLFLPFFATVTVFGIVVVFVVKAFIAVVLVVVVAVDFL